MGRYVLRRLLQSVFTVLGVMLLTFVLFRIIAGDVSAAFVSPKLGVEARQAFYEKHRLDRPTVFNYHRRLELVDHSSGNQVFSATDAGGSALSKALQLHIPAARSSDQGLRLVGMLIPSLSGKTALAKMTGGKPLVAKPEPDEEGRVVADTGSPALVLRLNDGSSFSVSVSGLTTCGQLIDAINNHPENRGRVTAGVSRWSFGQLFDSQFFWHLAENLTFSGRSYATDQGLFEIIGERARFSLALTVPIMALEWLIGLVIACLVAYYRDTWVDRLGVFLSVLGMCVPYLAYMLLGQWVMFQIAPSMAVGLSHPLSIYVPVMIATVAGLGSMVRFYRTIILDEINKDYVRTARAKGVALPGILFTHVLRNCMLPILTSLITQIPFLILGALLLERFFGIPGLGDLMLTSVTTRDVPIITGLTFLTTLLYVVSLLLTDILYAVFDPRIRLR